MKKKGKIIKKGLWNTTDKVFYDLFKSPSGVLSEKNRRKEYRWEKKIKILLLKATNPKGKYGYIKYPSSTQTYGVVDTIKGKKTLKKDIQDYKRKGYKNIKIIKGYF